MREAGAASAAREFTPMMYHRSPSWDHTVRLATAFVGPLDTDEAGKWDLSESAQKDRQGHDRVWTMHKPKTGMGLGWDDFVKSGGDLSARNGQGRNWMWGLRMKDFSDENRKSDFVRGAIEKTGDAAFLPDDLGQTPFHSNDNGPFLRSLLIILGKDASEFMKVKDVMGCTPIAAQILNCETSFPGMEKRSLIDVSKAFRLSGMTGPIESHKKGESPFELSINGGATNEEQMKKISNIVGATLLIEDSLAAKMQVDQRFADFASAARDYAKRNKLLMTSFDVADLDFITAIPNGVGFPGKRKI